MTIELELPAYQSFIKQQEIKDGQPTGKLKAGPKKIRVPDTVFEKGRMVGWKWTERSPVSLLKMLPDYDPFASAKGYYFDTNEWDRIIAFIVNECVYPEGELTGRSFIPELWQSSIYANLFCWKSVETGLRRYRECFIYVPRKNGKTTAFGAIITLIMFFVDSEKRSQNFCCAADSDQATVNFRHSQYMIENNPRLISRLKEKRVYRSTKSFEHTDGASFKVLSSVADTKHGLSPNFVYVDEVHAHPNSELVDVMKTGTAARRQPLIVYTTTADYDRPSVCNEMYSKAKMIASGKQWAPTFLPVIYEANVTDDFRNPTIWSRANPNYGKSITREYFEEMVRSVQDNPAELNRFLRLHLNIKTKTETAWIPPHVWANGNPDPDSVEMMSVVDIKNWMSEHPYWNNITCDRNFDTTSVDVQIANQGLYWSWFISKCEELRYEECYAGFDNSIVQDLAALSLWFPTKQTMLTWHWCPAASIYRRSQEQGLPYARWWEAGLLNSTAPLETTDDDSIVKTMLGDASYPGIFTHFQGLREICFDRFAMRVIYVRLKDYGYPARAYPQSFSGMNEPVRKMESMAIDKCMYHGGNPILEWEAGNVTIMTNHDGQRRPDKQKSTNKIDGIVASLMALGGSLYPEIETITDIRGLK